MGILSDMYAAINGLTAGENSPEMRRARSLKYFADGDPTVNHSQHERWQEACSKAGYLIPPKEFKESEKPA